MLMIPEIVDYLVLILNICMNKILNNPPPYRTFLEISCELKAKTDLGGIIHIHKTQTFIFN